MDTKSKNNFHHYFLPNEHNKSDYFTFDYSYKGKLYKFTSCDDVFSKNGIDDGSRVLVDTILKNADSYAGKILDICCGYGAISVLLDGRINATFDLCDISPLAIDLCKINVKNNCKKCENIFVSDMWQNVDKTYDVIVSNPPIKTGKKVLMEFLDGLNNHLKDGGKVVIVIKKNLGADSTKKYLTNIFNNCEVLERNKGYYILQSIKR